jgi:tetratricopeptide (TPR) repeat protein
MLVGTLVILVVVGCSGRPDGLDELSLYDAASYFSGGSSRERVARVRLLSDSTNNRIAVMCLKEARLTELEALGVGDLDQRLSALEDGRVIEVSDSTCSLSFPVFVGEEREALARVTSAAAAELSPLVETTIKRLEEELVDRQDMLFHLLWSRVIDVVWWDAFSLAFVGERPPMVSWVTYPSHRFAVGTNYESMPGNSSFAMTWSDGFDEHLSYFSEMNFELHQAAWGGELESVEARAGLQDYGVFDGDGDCNLFSYQNDERLDSVLTDLANRYTAALPDLIDWSGTADEFGLHAGDFFVIALHEVAYALFENLYEAGKLDVPDLLLEGSPKAQAVRLASVITDQPPGPLDQAMALFMKNGWHGSREAVAEFRAALEQDPDNREILWFLGLSLYDIEEYSEAIPVFERLVAVVEADPDEPWKHVWGLIWIGHAYDALGERARAIAVYESVLSSEGASARLQMGQYDIGPISAEEWALQRIAVPFEWK